jgi:tRNA G18 (ribose-2'-O)-methylase SpoU
MPRAGRRVPPGTEGPESGGRAREGAAAASIRRQLAGPAEIEAALEAGEPVRLVLAAREPEEPAALRALERARAAGVAVRPASAASLRRLSRVEPPAELLALVGPAPDADAATALASGGLVWLLVGLAYPGNTGFAIRLAEVSGAHAVFVDSAFLHEGRREALRASMRAERFMPVYWSPALDVIAGARAAGRRVLAVEDVGTRAPWETDLTTPLLLLIGGERHGIPPEVLDACDGAIALPMRGFIPSYNLQAAMAMVAGEHLRQLGGR